MNPRDLPIPDEGILLTHFMVVSDQHRSREFYRTVFAPRVVVLCRSSSELE